MHQLLFFSSDIDRLKSTIHSLEANRILLVRGKNSFFTSSANSFIKNLLGNLPYIEFYEFETNPKWLQMKLGVNLVKEYIPELIIAIGGGSVMDMAKMLSVYAFTPLEDRLLTSNEGFSFRKKIPVLAIPTTAGSGSEATQFSVIYHHNTKYSVDHPLLLPDYVYLSGSFSGKADSYTIAVSGLDALFQAIESIWSVNSTKESELYALEALKLSWNNLPLAIEKKHLALENMQLAAHLAGKAINLTRTTAPHAISYAFTTFYGIPHGHAVALSFPFFINYNYNLSERDCNDPRGVESVKNRIKKVFEIIECSPDTASRYINDYIIRLGVDTNIWRLIEGFNPLLITQNVNTQRLSNNPRVVNTEDLFNFLTNKHGI